MAPRSLKHKPRPMAMAVLAATAIILAGCVAERAVPPRPGPPPAAGELVLDAGTPIITAIVGGVVLRLRVDPGQWDAIELNPDAAARIAGLAWQADRTMQIGRVALAGRSAVAALAIEDRRLAVVVAEHGRAAVADADGVIGPDLLPFATLRWVRAGAPAADEERSLPLMLSATTGLTAEDPALQAPVRLRFSLMRPASEATAAAGSLLAERYGGHFDGPPEPLPVLFGVTRPARPLLFDRAPIIMGFRFARIAVRIADFRGDHPLPVDPQAAGEIVVAGRDHPQAAESWVTLAADRLSRCREITYRAAPRSLTLRCAFDK